jgi:hypothetical protein
MAALPRKWVSDSAPTLGYAAARFVNPGESILCLARPLLAAPFGPFVMCFLRTSQCIGWHDPFSTTNCCNSNLKPPPATQE